MSIQKKGRTLAVTVNDLMESQRLRIAIENYENDPMLLKAILIELGYEAQSVGKNTVIKQYATHSGMSAFELTPYLRNISDFTTYNIWWKLTAAEQAYYLAEVNNKGISKREKKKLFKKVHQELMGS